MSDKNLTELQDIILDVIKIKLSEEGSEPGTVTYETDVMSTRDSFGGLDAIMEIEERAGVSADLGEMNITNVMTISTLANEIIRINKQ